MDARKTMSHVVTKMSPAVRAKWAELENDIAARRAAARSALKELRIAAQSKAENGGKDAS
jgi:hypothetical protein